MGVDRQQAQPGRRRNSVGSVRRTPLHLALSLCPGLGIRSLIRDILRGCGTGTSGCGSRLLHRD
ncbi:hypothetical protein GCM10009771_07450 [Nesterenkonia flava]